MPTAFLLEVETSLLETEEDFVLTDLFLFFSITPLEDFVAILFDFVLLDNVEDVDLLDFPKSYLFEMRLLTDDICWEKQYWFNDNLMFFLNETIFFIWFFWSYIFFLSRKQNIF